jgi:MMP 1-O-methyltransferase
MAQLGCLAHTHRRCRDHLTIFDIVNSAEYSGPDRGTPDHHDDQTDNNPSCFAHDRHSPVASGSDHDHNERHHYDETWFGANLSRQDHDHHNRR